MIGVVGRCRNTREQQIDQRLEVGPPHLGIERGGAITRNAVDDREVDLLLGGVEIEEEFVDLVNDVGDARIGAVDLVDDEDDRELAFERLAEHEAGLGERALGSVDEQERAIDHGEAAFDLATEVGVAGGVDDVHLDVADTDGRVFGEDGDALFALEVVRVHDPVDDLGARIELPGLLEQGVDERGLAVIDVRDDGDVADVLADSALGGRRRDGGG